MLQSDEMYNIPDDELGQRTSELTIYSLPFSLVTTFCMSYIYEILGRKLTLFLSFLTTSVVFYFLPYTSPSWTNLVLVRCSLGITMSAPLCHPLVPDYIHK